MSLTILLAPGAGKPSSSAWMEAWADRLQSLGQVVAFDHPYQVAGRKRPDRMPTLVAHARGQWEQVQARGPVVFVGKSMGARVGCHLSLEVPLHAVIAMGYPLAGGGDRSKLRDAVLRELTTPILFVQGTRDRLAPLDLFDEVAAGLTTRHRRHVVPTGDHSLLVTKTHTKQTGRTQADEDADVLSAMRTFLADLGPG